MKKYRLYWRTGKENIVEGTDIADACRRAGIGNGALSALDHYKEIKEIIDLSKVELKEISMRLITTIGSRTFEENIPNEEKFMADLIVAIRNGKSPADALCFLADIGSDNLGNPRIQISKANRIGSS